MKYTKKNISDIPIEQAHGGLGARQILVKSEELITKNFEAMTKGFLEAGKIFDWHEHTNIDEFFIVVKGNRKFYWLEEVVEYA